MSGFKCFAVAGAGTIGTYIVAELLKVKAKGEISEVRILTRSPPGKHYDFASSGATIVSVDYSSYRSIVTALAGIDVLVSTVGYEAFELQATLADAGKAARVQLFVPSEFGFATAGRAMRDIPPLFRPKEIIRRRLMQIGLPYAVFYTGPFPDYVFTEPEIARGLGFDFSNRRFFIAGTGFGSVSFTGRADVARYFAYVLTHLPRERLLWKIFRIEGERTSLKNIIRQYEERTGEDVLVSERAIEETEAAHANNPNDFFSTILLAAERGLGVVGSKEELDNSLFPDWRPSKVIDLIMSNVS